MTIIPDILEHKLKTAKEMGADATVLIDRNHSLEEISTHIIELLQGEQPDKTIDCSGIESTIKLGMLVSCCCSAVA
jgi:Threonine dehydrogenase and related Zn-dependent dehydrogenases